MDSAPRISIVGGGPSAVCLLDAFVRDGPHAAELTVFDPAPQLWRGRPYQADIDAIRVNAVPADMSVRAGDEEHLQVWLTARSAVTGRVSDYRDPLSGAWFVPRAVFGDYLEQSARHSLRVLVERGWRVRIIRERVLEVRDRGGEGGDPYDRALLLRTDRGTEAAADHVVLCFGAGRPADPYHLDGAPGFVGDPYPTTSALAGIDKGANVAVLGAGLTGVDVVLALDASGHRGPIQLLSRSGVLPGVRQRPIRHRLKYFTRAAFRDIAAVGGSLTLADIVAVMDDELRAAGEDLELLRREIAAVTLEEPVARLRRNLAEVDSPSIALRILQQAVPDAGPDVWPLLGDAEQARLLTAFDRTLMSLCCPMPPSNAARLLALIDAGRVHLHRGLRRVRPRPGGGFVIDGVGGSGSADVVVNAVNARKRVLAEGAEPLVASLVRAGLAQPHPRGGVWTERATSRLTVDGRPVDPRIHALGDPALGSLFFTFGVQSLVDRAVDIVVAIRDLAARPATAAGEHLKMIPS